MRYQGQARCFSFLSSFSAITFLPFSFSSAPVPYLSSSYQCNEFLAAHEYSPANHNEESSVRDNLKRIIQPLKRFYPSRGKLMVDYWRMNTQTNLSFFSSKNISRKEGACPPSFFISGNFESRKWDISIALLIFHPTRLFLHDYLFSIYHRGMLFFHKSNCLAITRFLLFCFYPFCFFSVERRVSAQLSVQLRNTMSFFLFGTRWIDVVLMDALFVQLGNVRGIYFPASAWFHLKPLAPSRNGV